ncbi:hypothetical protein PPGU19_100260 (plasmid) [Paraburkholderia sp. PGU19]|uniref:hypothetical protein n=1 Tax=Paraburkholderia sp. PGU19 TaxID=2735434 RepID=UPI0015DB677B|nr:hypothetical protein [Paraburkholderia sp. PGU19]BCG05458.1 hypothetical protein PPGU19_100260 [Paraburkholderia sp. PGU19]
MDTQPKEQLTPDDRTEDAVDEAVEDAFPASDEPATGGTTRIEKPSGSDVPGSDPDEDVTDDDTSDEPSPADVPPDEVPPQGR